MNGKIMRRRDACNRSVSWNLSEARCRAMRCAFLICFHTKHSKAQLTHANMLVGRAQCAETTLKLDGMPARAMSNANVLGSSNSPELQRV